MGRLSDTTRTVTVTLRNYVNDHQDDLDVYASALTYAYNNQIHKSTKTKPFERVLNHLPTDFTLQPDVGDRPAATREARDDFLERIDIAI